MNAWKTGLGVGVGALALALAGALVQSDDMAFAGEKEIAAFTMEALEAPAGMFSDADEDADVVPSHSDESVTHWYPSGTHKIPSIYHQANSEGHQLISGIHNPPSKTHFSGSQTHTSPSVWHNPDSTYPVGPDPIPIPGLEPTDD